MRTLLPKVQELLNKRITNEEMSSRIYLSMAMFLENNGYLNSAKLWRKYSEEESSHANKVREYLLSLSIQPIVPTLQEPDDEFIDLADVIKKTFEHELQITKECEELSKCVLEAGDFLTFTLSQWLVAEQVEELNKSSVLVDQLRSFGEDKIAQRLLDHEIAEYL